MGRLDVGSSRMLIRRCDRLGSTLHPDGEPRWIAVGGPHVGPIGAELSPVQHKTVAPNPAPFVAGFGTVKVTAADAGPKPAHARRAVARHSERRAPEKLHPESVHRRAPLQKLGYEVRYSRALILRAKLRDPLSRCVRSRPQGTVVTSGSDGSRLDGDLPSMSVESACVCTEIAGRCQAVVPCDRHVVRVATEPS